MEVKIAPLLNVASKGPRSPNARLSTVSFIRRPLTGGPSSRWRAEGSAPRATAERYRSRGPGEDLQNTERERELPAAEGPDRERGELGSEKRSSCPPS